MWEKWFGLGREGNAHFFKERVVRQMLFSAAGGLLVEGGRRTIGVMGGCRGELRPVLCGVPVSSGRQYSALGVSRGRVKPRKAGERDKEASHAEGGQPLRPR
jgi:hypothetical protein